MLGFAHGNDCIGHIAVSSVGRNRRWAYFAYRLPTSARAEERRRRQQGQPHTRRDDALLLLTALSVVGVLLCAMFLKPLNVLVNSRAGIAATILVVGGGLTYIHTFSIADALLVPDGWRKISITH